MDTESQRPRLHELTERFIGSRALVLLFFVALNFVAHYLHFRNLGLNGEDYSHILLSLDKNPSFVLNITADTFSALLKGSLGLEGRAFGLLSTRALAATGWMIGGVPGMHLVSWFLSTACSYILYRAFAQRGDFLHGFIAALFITLYPAYALRQYLNGQFWLIPSLIFMLLAVKSLMAERKILPYAFIACSLLTYESPVFPFMAAPLLLDAKWDRRFIKRFALHFIIMTALLAIVFWLRTTEREGRVLELGSYLADVPPRVAIFITYGTFISTAYSIYYAIVKLLQRQNAATLSIFLVTAPIFAYIIYTGSLRKTSTVGNARYLKYVVSGVIFIMLAYTVGFFPYYSITMTEPAATLAGVVSRVHMAASFGAAVFFSSLCMLVLHWLKNNLAQFAVASSVAVLLAILAGYSYVIQEYYKDGWQYQQCLWTKIIEEAPDVGDGTVIFVDQRGLPYAENHPAGFSWYTLLRSFPYIYEFPADWTAEPRAALRYAEWRDELSVRHEGGKTEINLAPFHSAPRWIEVEQENLIMFKTYKKDIVRFDGAMSLGGKEIRLKPKPQAGFNEERLKKGFFHDSVLRPGCTFTALADVKPPRDIENAPRLSKTLYFNGTNHLSARLSDAKTKNFTIELWLKPGENQFNAEGVMDKKYPPMPAIIGPLRLDHGSIDVMSIGIAERNTNITREIRDMFGSGDKKRWMHVELDVDNARREAILFMNGRAESRFTDIEVPLIKDIQLGKGHFERFWQGELADVRISSIVRHAEDFAPEKAAVTRDEHTLYFLGD